MDNSMTIITIEQLRNETALKALNKERSDARAAYVMGISERTLRRWKERYGIAKCPVTREYFLIESNN